MGKNNKLFLRYKYFNNHKKYINKKVPTFNKPIVFKPAGSFNSKIFSESIFDNKSPPLLPPPPPLTKDSGTNTDNNDKKKSLDFFKLMTPLKSIFTIEPPPGLTPEKNIIEERIEKRKELEKLPYEILDCKIENIGDLIAIGKDYENKYKEVKKNFNLDTKVLNSLVEPLTKLNNLIGLQNVKNQIFEQLIFYLQNLDSKNYDMLHTVIEGEPGIGKTELAKILASIYKNMGVLSKGTFKSVKRADLIGGYLGQTSIKTKKVLDDAKGGVLFIDEAYSLGNKEGKDSYSKECIDALTAFLSEEREDCVVIIAGYKDDLQKCFFSYNSGLERRFNWRFSLEKYSAKELRDIFVKIVRDYDWDIKSEKDIPTKFFEKNRESFKFNGGDMETLFQKCKMAHSIRVLKFDRSEKKILDKNDLDKGYKLFMNGKNVDKSNEDIIKSMYL